MSDIDARIAALEELEKAATPALWEVSDDRDVFIYDDKSTALELYFARCDRPKEDAELIVALRNEALGIIREQQAEIRRLRAGLHAVRDPYYSDPEHIDGPDGCPPNPCPACERQVLEAQERALDLINEGETNG